jgi:hypothetical protein
MWALGLSRFDGETWWDTAQIVHDARGAHRMFAVAGMLEAQPGDLLVYGDGGGHQGHVGVIAVVTPLPEAWPLQVAHCSAGNFRRTGDAIRETGPDIWLHRSDAVVARCLVLTEDLIA